MATIIIGIVFGALIAARLFWKMASEFAQALAKHSSNECINDRRTAVVFVSAFGALYGGIAGGFSVAAFF